ncbi:hypothetical protein [Anditalea andensis]|uniref:Uncharacterized protein n=1 Tax=Anditalea andensis TaxID=1048983 RepID=A0A074LP44_9BACT|nr:hypothetical protein [Anditalea andensis]KEO75672.1 hypothetical protein EL17_21810 [Anditalea andensis]
MVVAIHLNLALLFIDLIESEEHFPPTMMYPDHAITIQLFHWQAQYVAGPVKEKRLGYVRQRKDQAAVYTRKEKDYLRLYPEIGPHQICPIERLFRFETHSIEPVSIIT